jgi:hypothetical protein
MVSIRDRARRMRRRSIRPVAAHLYFAADSRQAVQSGPALYRPALAGVCHFGERQPAHRTGVRVLPYFQPRGTHS